MGSSRTGSRSGPGTKTPLGGIVVNVFFAAAGLVIATPLADKSDPIRVVGTTFTLIVMLIYLLLVWGAVRLAREQRHLWPWPILAVATALPALAMYGTLPHSRPAPPDWAYG